MLNAPEARHLLKLFEAIEEFRKLAPEMQAQQMQTFLLVAQKPDISVTEIAERLGIAGSSASRNVDDLGRGRRGRKGHEVLSAVENQTDRRKKDVNLTARGRRIVESMLSILNR